MHIFGTLHSKCLGNLRFTVHLFPCHYYSSTWKSLGTSLALHYCAGHVRLRNVNRRQKFCNSFLSFLYLLSSYSTTMLPVMKPFFEFLNPGGWHHNCWSTWRGFLFKSYKAFASQGIICFLFLSRCEKRKEARGTIILSFEKTKMPARNSNFFKWRSQHYILLWTHC